MIRGDKVFSSGLIGGMAVVLFTLFSSVVSLAQADALKEEIEGEEQWYQPKVDTSIVNLYDKTFGLMIYLQQKNIRQNYKMRTGNSALSYEPNIGVNLGLGFIYRYLTLSATYNIIGNEPKEAIKTSNFDFQSQLAFRRAVSFLYLQYYKGFFSDQPAFAAPGAIYARPDASLFYIAASTAYGLKKDFAFNGSIAAVQWQRKSGGTPFVALDAYLSINRGEGALVPATGADFYHEGIVRHRTWSVGLGAGYAHTFVIKKHFFITGIATAKEPLNFTRQTYDDGSIVQEQSSGLTYALWGRIGYNTDRWNLSLTATNNRNPVGGDFFAPAFASNVGYLRLGYTRRLTINKKTRKQLKPVDDFLDVPYKVMEKLIP